MSVDGAPLPAPTAAATIALESTQSAADASAARTRHAGGSGGAANDAPGTETFVLRVATSERNESPRRVARRRLRPAEREFIWEQTGRRCYMCKTALPRKGGWHIEHVLAFSADPRANDVLGNMLAACGACNRRKLDRPLMECVRLGIACDLATSIGGEHGGHLNTAARACLLAALRVKHRRQHCNAGAWGPNGPARAPNARAEAGQSDPPPPPPPPVAPSSTSRSVTDGATDGAMDGAIDGAIIDSAIDAVEREVEANADTLLAASDVRVDWEQAGVCSGAFGEVYKGALRPRLQPKSKGDAGGGAEDEHVDVDVGVKLSKGFARAGDQDNVDDGDGSGVILAELVALRSLCMRGEHRNIVRFYGVVLCTPFGDGESSAQASIPRRLPGLVFEWCDFHLMSMCVARFANVVELVAQAADALAFLHKRGFLHRDVKPHNVLVQKAAQMPWSTAVAKLADFGTARRVLIPQPEGELANRQPGHPAEAQQTPNVGTFDYRAPEAEHGRYYEQTDVYALGKTMYVLQRQKWNAIFRPVAAAAGPPVSGAQAAAKLMTRSSVRCVKRGWEEAWRACVIETPHTARPAAAEVRDRLRRLQRAEPPPPTLRESAQQNTTPQPQPQHARDVALRASDKATEPAAAATARGEAAAAANAGAVPAAAPSSTVRGASASADARTPGSGKARAASSPWLTDQWVIVSKKATRRGNWKYHRLAGCGNMVASRRISIEEAERIGCAPCRHCCRGFDNGNAPDRTPPLSHAQSPGPAAPSLQASPSPWRQRRPWTEQEEANLRAGVSRFAGERQKWKRILDAYVFAEGRTNVDLKDKWRNLQQRDKKDGGRHAPPTSLRPTASSTRTLVSHGFQVQSRGKGDRGSRDDAGNGNRLPVPQIGTTAAHVPAALTQRDENQH